MLAYILYTKVDFSTSVELPVLYNGQSINNMLLLCNRFRDFCMLALQSNLDPIQANLEKGIYSHGRNVAVITDGASVSYQSLSQLTTTDNPFSGAVLTFIDTRDVAPRTDHKSQSVSCSSLKLRIYISFIIK